MKIQLRVQFTFLVAVITGIFLVTSCQSEDETYAKGDFIVTFGVAEKNNNPAENNLQIHLDNGNTFVAYDQSLHLDEIQPNQRLLINFAPSRDVLNADKTKTIYGKINFVQNILYKNILPLAASSHDSIGHDPIIVRDSWITGDSILTIDYKYYTQGSLHNFNLVRYSEGNGIDKPYIFELRHNSKGDLKSYSASGYISFKLNSLKITNQHKTLFKIRYTDYEGRTIEIPHSISY